MHSVLVGIQLWEHMTGLPDFSSTEKTDKSGEKKTSGKKMAPFGEPGHSGCVVSAHQRRGERQTSHWGFQLIHGGRDASGAVRHQRFDPDFELLLAVLVLFWVTGGEKVLFFGSWWARLKRNNCEGKSFEKKKLLKGGKPFMIFVWNSTYEMN